MNPAFGSRSYEIIDYRATSILSGVDHTDPIKRIGNTIIIRRDLVNYAYEFLSYKIALIEPNIDIAIKWHEDEWVCPHNKIFKRPLKEDVRIFFGIMEKFEVNFNKANTWKVQY